VCYEAPDRRTFGKFLAAAGTLTALAACSPGKSPATALSAPGPTEPASTGATGASASAAPSATASTATPSATAAPAPSAGAPGPQHSLDDPSSPWVVVNKHRPLVPATFVPPDLVQPAVSLAVSGEAALLNSTTAGAAEAMFAAAEAGGVVLTLASGYRSYSTQIATYNTWVSTEGQAAADTASARPGYSEHQTGWAFDIGDGSGACGFEPCFAEQPAAVWARENAHRFGFVVRYPWMLHEVTGYYFEPWHLRYIGPGPATDMKTRGIATLEQYFGLEAAPAYF
jgi:D-alanyl-D-alanine carboxypeptidase